METRSEAQDMMSRHVKVGSIPLTPIWRESLLGVEFGALLRNGVFRDPPSAPRSLPMMLIPGFLTGDAQLGTLAAWLRRCGHRTHTSGIRLNVDCSAAAIGRLEQRLRGMGRAGGRARGRDRPEPRRPVRARARGAAPRPRRLGRDARLAASRSPRGASARLAAGRRDRRPGGARRAGAGEPPLPQRQLLRAIRAGPARADAQGRALRLDLLPDATASSTGRCAWTRTRITSRCARHIAAWP